MANRPILFHSLEALRAAGILEATILADGPAARAIRAAVGAGRDWGINIRYATWSTAGGLAGALAAGRDFLGGEPVLVQEGGALLRDRLHGHISAFAREGLDALALRLAAPAPKQRQPDPGYLLSARAVSMLLDGRDAAANPVAGLEARGGRVRIQSVDGCLPCHGDQDALLDSNRRMLEQHLAPIDALTLPGGNKVQGLVEVHPTAEISNSVLRGPLIIGPGARVREAYIGPYSSIGAGAVIEGTEIEHSIVLPDAQLRFVGARLESSVIGRGARVLRGFDVPSALRMSLGDGAEVHLR